MSKVQKTAQPAAGRSLRATLTEGLATEAGNNISWRSVFAGLVTFISLSLLFTLVGAAIGLGGTDLTAADPTAGVGTGLAVWTIFSLILSLGLAGFIAGLTANRAGFIHGFLTWATGVIAIVILATSAVSSAFGAVGNMLGTAGRAAGDVVSTATNATGDVFNLVAEQVELDTTGIDREVITALENSKIEQLHPDYLQSQLDATIKDVQDAGKRIVVDGEDAGAVAEDVKGNIEERVASVTKNIDRPTLEREIAANTDMSQREVSQAADNIVSAYEDAQKNAEKQLNNLQSGAQEAFDRGVVVANDAMNNTAKYSLYLFAGLVIAAIVTTGAGVAGSRFGNKVQNV
ncbi:YrzE family protein [Rothia sp. ZJ932]|uniref:YrzE family protein n=1 Tax=Rothia sp. ZJ932 TaxID=2810516 RepID=UPI0019688060|nr:YrzE family protein [Rothia sp. ZJ932]QRZ61633.1 YrzE family protein [Rothia sp. ZJ932]